MVQGIEALYASMPSPNVFALNLGGILREFGEILGKYRIFDERPLGSIGLRTDTGV